VIPHEATLTIDLRNPDDDHMTAAEQHLASYVDELAARHGVQVAWERMAKTAVVPFHPGIQDLLGATADDLGLPYVRAMSGAGHDAKEISATCPPRWCPSPARPAASATPRANTPPPAPAPTAPTCSPTPSCSWRTSRDRQRPDGPGPARRPASH